jgi:hypothetical protein
VARKSEKSFVERVDPQKGRKERGGQIIQSFFLLFITTGRVKFPDPPTLLYFGVMV